MINKIKSQFSQIPQAVRLVALKGLGLWAVFYVCYYYIFLPHGKLIRFFTHVTASVTTYFLNHLYAVGFTHFDSPPYGDTISLGSRHILFIMDGCNAFKLYVLYAGFLFCAPGKVNKKINYLLVGLPAIFVLNIIRCYAVAILVIQKPEWIEIAHHYIFTFVVYGTIFWLWLSFLKEKKGFIKTQ